MSDARTFEWDEAKAQANLAKHGVPFEAAAAVFDDVRMQVAPDLRRNYGEDRFVGLGEVDGMILSIAFTERGGQTRIISARQASRKERKRYGDG